MTEKWTELKTMRDELKLQAHLFGQELSDTWEEFELRFKKLEQRLIKAGEKLGKAEESFLVGDEEEIQELIAHLRDIQDSHGSNNSES